MKKLICCLVFAVAMAAVCEGSAERESAKVWIADQADDPSSIEWVEWGEFIPGEHLPNIMFVRYRERIESGVLVQRRKYVFFDDEGNAAASKDAEEIATLASRARRILPEVERAAEEATEPDISDSSARIWKEDGERLKALADELEGTSDPVSLAAGSLSRAARLISINIESMRNGGGSLNSDDKEKLGKSYSMWTEALENSIPLLREAAGLKVQR